MSHTRSKRSRSKKKKSEKLFLLTSKECWLIDEKLLPFYQHLVDDYSDKLREEWTVKVEDTDVEVVQQVKEEPQEYYLVDSQQLQLSRRMNQLKVVISCDEWIPLLNILFAVPYRPLCRPYKMLYFDGLVYGIDDVIVLIWSIFLKYLLFSKVL